MTKRWAWILLLLAALAVLLVPLAYAQTVTRNMLENRDLPGNFRFVESQPSGACTADANAGRAWLNGSNQIELYCCISSTWTSCASVATPAGSDTYVQINSSGAFGSDAEFTYNGTSDTLSLRKLNGISYLAAYADSGSGTSADPWVISSTGWDLIKGGRVNATGFFETDHGALLDWSDGTRIHCEGGEWNLPPEPRDSANAMFLVDADAHVEVYGCTFGPGVTTPDGTGPCQHRSDNNVTGTCDSGNTTTCTDTGAFTAYGVNGLVGYQVIAYGDTSVAQECLVASNDNDSFTCDAALQGSGTWDAGEAYSISQDEESGTSYITVGATVGDPGTATLIMEDVHFGQPRTNVVQSGISIRINVGMEELTMRDVSTDVTNEFIKGYVRDSTNDNSYDTVMIDSFFYDGEDYTNKTCGKTQPTIDWDDDSQGAGNVWSFESFTIQNSLIHGTDKFMELALDGQNFRFLNNHGIGGFFDGWFSWQPYTGTTGSGKYGVVRGNSCYDEEATTASQGCEIDFISVDYLQVSQNTWRSRGHNVYVSFTDVNNAQVTDNWVDGRALTAGTLAEFLRIGGDCDNILVANNTAIDVTDLVDLSTGPVANLTIRGNTLHASSDNDYNYFLLDVNGVTCTNCYMIDNHMTGDEGTQAAYTDDTTALAYDFNNTYKTDWSADALSIPNSGINIGGTQTISAPADEFAAGVYTNDNGTMTINNAAAIYRNSSLVSTVNASSHADGNVAFTDPTNAYDGDLTTFAEGNGNDGIFLFFTGASGDYVLETTWSNDGGHNNGGSSAFYVCSTATTTGTHDGANNAATLTDSGESWTINAFIGTTVTNSTDGSSCTVTDSTATTVVCTLSGGTDNDWDTGDSYSIDSCDPTTLADEFFFTFDYPSGLRRQYHAFGTVDPDDVVLYVYNDDNGGVPSGARYQTRVHNALLSTEEFRLDMPDAGYRFFDAGAFPPARCTVPSFFIDTDETDDTNVATTNDNAILGCFTEDTWTVVEDD